MAETYAAAVRIAYCKTKPPQYQHIPWLFSTTTIGHYNRLFSTKRQFFA